MMEELIERFFRKDCTRREAQEVIAYLSEHPEVLDRHLSLEEWEQSPPVQMNNEFWDEVWTEVQAKKKRVRSRRIWMKRAAAAASIAAIAIVAYGIWLQPTRQEKSSVAALKPVIEQERKIVLNNTATLMKINLPDSSLVSLSPGSVIVYEEPFSASRRDITLEGKGRFRVKEDHSKPFTVYAGGISTTALGTEFTINTHERQSNNTTVKLHTGKVVIKNTGARSTIFPTPVYLIAGQQLNYNESEKLLVVAAIQNETEIKSATKIAKRNRPDKPFVKNELSFVNSSLADVMIDLSRYFSTKIEFDDTELHGKNFTGTVSQQDSLPVVLKVIAQMNGLEVIDNNGGFRVQTLKPKTN